MGEEEVSAPVSVTVVGSDMGGSVGGGGSRVGRQKISRGTRLSREMSLGMVESHNAKGGFLYSGSNSKAHLSLGGSFYRKSREQVCVCACLCVSV